MINWKVVTKYFYEQFMLWVKAYNEIADVNMIGESRSSGSSCYSVTHITYECPRGGLHVYKWDGTLPTDEMLECEKCGHRR